MEEVRRRIASAAQAAGRDAGAIHLIAVTKTVSAQQAAEAVAAGIANLGENRVQEGIAKRAALGRQGRQVRWHLIGHLQRNKARLAAETFDVVHSVDSVDLAARLGQVVRPAGKLGALVQVNVSGEASKHGCRPEEAKPLVQAILEQGRLDWLGLMTMAPWSEDPEAAAPHFRRLRELRDRLRSDLLSPEQREAGVGRELSMGMTGDFEAAVREGATMVRIGTAIFGEREG